MDTAVSTRGNAAKYITANYKQNSRSNYLSGWKCKHHVRVSVCTLDISYKFLSETRSCLKRNFIIVNIGLVIFLQKSLFNIPTHKNKICTIFVNLRKWKISSTRKVYQIYARISYIILNVRCDFFPLYAQFCSYNYTFGGGGRGEGKNFTAFTYTLSRFGFSRIGKKIVEVNLILHAAACYFHMSTWVIQVAKKPA